MRILVVTNYYPPHFFGGYELGCRDVVEGLRQRGHDVAVLTSDYQATPASGEDAVTRDLPLKSGQDGWPLFLRSVAKFLQALHRNRPDVVYFWNQAGLSYWLAPLARKLGYRSVFFISDTSFRSWRIGAFLRRWVRNPENPNGLLSRSVLVQGRPIVRGSRCQFASDFLRQLTSNPGEGSPGCVIHWGVDAALFRPPPEERRSLLPRRILYVGQIIPEKGVATLLEAVRQLLAAAPKSASLTIVGGSSKPAYLAQLHENVRAAGLSESIRFAGKRARRELVELYHAHDLLVLPSLWEEPFAITPLEAMACGLAVVATTTGGSAEIFRDGENSLTFRAGDAAACAAAIARLQREPDLYARIRQQGMTEVASRFTLEGMIAKVDSDLFAFEKSL